MKKKHLEIAENVYELAKTEAKRLGMSVKSFSEKSIKHACKTHAARVWALEGDENDEHSN